MYMQILFDTFHIQLDGKNCCPQSERNSIQYIEIIAKKTKVEYVFVLFIYNYKKEYCIGISRTSKFRLDRSSVSKINHKTAYTFHYKLTNANNRRAKKTILHTS